MKEIIWTPPEGAMVRIGKSRKPVPAGDIRAVSKYGILCMLLKHGFVNLDKVRVVMPNVRSSGTRDQPA
jgi:hypothetical protein